MGDYKELVARLNAPEQNYFDISAQRQQAAEAIESQAREIERLSAESEDSAKNILRLIETIKYLRGIAVKGEGRECRDDETVESFVLGYVKRIESELAALKSENERLSAERDIEFHKRDLLLDDIAEIKAAYSALERELAALKKQIAEAEPAADVVVIAQGGNRGKQVVLRYDVPNGSELYLHPTPAVQGGWQLVTWKNLVGHLQPTATINGTLVELDDLTHRLKQHKDSDSLWAADFIEMVYSLAAAPKPEGEKA